MLYFVINKNVIQKIHTCSVMNEGCINISEHYWVTSNDLLPAAKRLHVKQKNLTTLTDSPLTEIKTNVFNYFYRKAKKKT